jgi:cytoskeletal protein CcmA (bactofilin family)
MYVIHNCVFTPDLGGFDQVIVPGVYTADQFSSITNITKNTILYVSTDEHLGSITVTDDGVQTTVLVYPATSDSEPTDELQVLAYDDAPGTLPGPATNVAVTNWPASQNVNGAVSINDEVEVKNDAGNPLAVSGTVSVGNFPATQPVSGSVSVSNFPSTQAVTGTFFQATQPVSGSVSVSNFPASTTVNGTVDVGNFPATQTVDGSVTISNDSGSPVPVTFPSGVSVNNFPATQTVDGTVDVGNFPATQTVDGSVSVSNFPATTTVDGAVTVSGTVDVGNFPTSTTVSGTVDVGNFPTTQTVDGSVTVSGTVDIGNYPATQTVDGTVDVGNFPTTFDVGNFPATQTVDGTVDVGNFPATQTVDGSVSVSNFPATQPVSGSVSVSNFPATQPVSGSVSISNFPATQSVTQGTSPWIVSSTGGSTNIATFPSTSTDAFGRLRVSEPFTMFDSSFRYGDNQLWSQATATGGTATYNAAQGLMDLSVTTTSGSSVQRQTTKVFSYQPGKSLLVMTTFVCAAPKANLDQKVGYYSSDNGYFLEQDGLTTYFVERSAVSGAVTNTRVAQSAWNVDPMDGTGPSGITLDISKAQILWMDLEWLGVGTVKMGFVINGTFYICHEWDHANLITSTYITTASLPLSCEITNTGTTASASTFKQICATVISEGGYALTGLQQSVGTPVTTPKTLAVAGTFYPIVSIRLKTTRLDAIAILTALAIQGTGNNNVFRWEVRAAGTTTGGSWVSAGANSSVEYNLTGTAYTNGRVLAAGFTSSSNQGTPSINILKEALFANQLERDIFTATPYELTIVVAGATGGTSCYASMDWEEVSR